MSRDINPFGLRMSPELRAKLESASREADRSMNAEIVHRLADTFKPKESADAAGDIYNHVVRVLNEIRQVHADIKRMTTKENLTVEQAVIENRRIEIGMIERELSRVSHDLIAFETSGDSLTDPNFQKLRHYMARLQRFNQMITRGLEFMLDAEFMPLGDLEAEVHEFPSKKAEMK